MNSYQVQNRVIMNSYEVQNRASYHVNILFGNQAGELVPYNFGKAFLIDLYQNRDQLTRSASWWLPVSSVTGILGGEAVYPGEFITLRLTNGPFTINLSGDDNDYYNFAKELNRAFPRLKTLVTKLRVPANTDLRPFFSELKAKTFQCKLATGEGTSEHLISLLESTVLNQTMSTVEIDNKLTTLELSQLRLIGQPGTPSSRNTALLYLSLELDLNEEDPPASADVLAKWLFRFQNLKHVQICGDFHASFMTPFLKALKDGNQLISNGPGLSAKCLTIEFLDVFGEEDTPQNNDTCKIGRQCEELVLETIRDWKGGFLLISLGSQNYWKNDSWFRSQLQYEATVKWMTEAPHLGTTAIRVSNLGPKISMMDVCDLIESGQHLFPPPNFPELFPGMLESEIPIDTDCLSKSSFKFQLFFDLLMKNPAMVAVALEKAEEAPKHKRIRLH